MIGIKVPVPVKKNTDGNYVVPVETSGENRLEAAVTRNLYEQTEMLRQILNELRLLNARFEAAYDTTINKEDVEDINDF